MSRIETLSTPRSWQCTQKTLSQATEVGFGGCHTVGRQTTHYQPPFAIADPKQSKRHYSQSVVRRRSLLQREKSAIQMNVDAKFIGLLRTGSWTKEQLQGKEPIDGIQEHESTKKDASSTIYNVLSIIMIVTMIAFWIWIAMDLDANLVAAGILGEDSTWTGSQPIMERIEFPLENMAGRLLVIGTILAIANGIKIAVRKMM